MWAANKFSSRPEKPRIFKALTELFRNILDEPGKKGLVIPFEQHTGKFIIFSDQHKGRRNGADDFMQAEPNYLAALDYYSNLDFYFINNGDSEELWENNLWQVRKKNKATFEAEKKFLAKNRYIKIFGNHDLFWDNDPLAWWQLKSIFGEKLKVYEGVILVTEVKTSKPILRQPVGSSNMQAATIHEGPFTSHHSPLSIFCTHGHQGDASSDGNWFSKFFVAKIWAPLQALLRINPNTPAYNAEKKTVHNHIMYEWSSEQKDMLLVTGHTHQPVFQSLTVLERLYKQLQQAEHDKNEASLNEVKKEILKREKEFTAVSVDYMHMRPSYFNSGCCCYSDGDITGIEIADGCIRLIKWTIVDEKSVRVLLEEISLQNLVEQL
jgi:UDP-2,3-diacylglucosamine pyrophosphatase LpxH